jgi:hypothetical protein
MNRREMFAGVAAVVLFSAPLPADALEAIRDAVAGVFSGCRVKMLTEDPATDGRWWTVRVEVGERRFCMAGGFDKLDRVPMLKLTEEAKEAAERLKRRLVDGTWHSPLTEPERARLV